MPASMALRLCCALAAFGAARSGTVPLGVSPQDESKYAGTSFRCLKGDDDRQLPTSSVNDEFCDCDDGSDEPGTGACAGQDMTLFFCRNEGSVPRQLYASRVGDGLCDCCDGSDEASLKSRGGPGCPNTCQEDGRLEREKRDARIAALQVGLDAKRKGVEQATADKAKRQEEVKALEAETPRLKAELEARKGPADEEREAERLEKERQKAEELKKCDVLPETCKWLQTGGCSKDGKREPEKDKNCTEKIPSGSSGFCDCNGDGKLDDDEPGYGCTGSPANCCEACLEKAQKDNEDRAAAEAAVEAAKSAEAAKEAEDAEKPQVSEYAKWMDGAASTLGGEEEGKEEAKEEPAAAEEAAPAKEEGDEACAAGDAGCAAGEPEKPKEKSAVELESEARRALNDHEDKIRKIQEEDTEFPDESYYGFQVLKGVELKQKVGEHEYKLNFFNDAKQGYTSLGSWKGFKSLTEGEFEGGQRCWDGPERKLRVRFQCGGEAKVLDVTEPSKCVYEALVAVPAACSEDELASLQKNDGKVYGPMDPV